MFEPRRFVELRKQSFWTQVKSAESFGMGLFYTLNVFFLQFYLGARLSLEIWMSDAMMPGPSADTIVRTCFVSHTQLLQAPWSCPVPQATDSVSS